MKKPKKEPEADLVRVWGYARVSTEEQNLDMQLQALERYGVHPDWILSEKRSATLSKRPELAKLWKELRTGDTLVVWALDRLGRDVRDLVNRMAELVERGVRFVAIRDSIDTSTAVGKLMLNVRAAMAQFERDLTSERTRAGIAARRARGLPHGQEPRFDRKEMEKLLRKGMRGQDVAAKLGVSKSAIYQAMTPELRRDIIKLRKGEKSRRGRKLKT